MLVGSTGSGKEVFARAIHDHSNRVKGYFLALNCAAIPESLIEGILFGTKERYTPVLWKRKVSWHKADGGTVFLDEVNSMPLASQAKLLRVLEERKIMKLGSKKMDIDVRIIRAPMKSLVMPLTMATCGKICFIASVVQISIPPLEDRKEDIPCWCSILLPNIMKDFIKMCWV